MMYRITDKKDQWVAFVEGYEKAVATAIDHCVLEGLRVVACNFDEHYTMFVAYIDPDDGIRDNVLIENIDSMLLW